MHRLLYLSLFLFNLSIALQAQKSTGIRWLSLAELEAAHQAAPKKVIIDIYTDWCGWCKRMDKATFQDSAVAAYVNEHFYAVKLNAETKDSLRFGNQIYTYVAQGRRGYNELAAALSQGKLSYPTVAYLNEKLELIQPLPGYMGPEDFLPVIHYFGEDAYLVQPFEQFKRNFGK